MDVGFDDIFVLESKFLDLKFQAIKIELSDFDKLKDNAYILNELNSKYCNKKYLAKRTSRYCCNRESI